MESIKEAGYVIATWLLRGFGFGGGLYAAFKLLYLVDTFV